MRCEEILRAAHERGDLPLTSIRPTATYGGRRGMVHSFVSGTAYHDRIRIRRHFAAAPDAQLADFARIAPDHTAFALQTVTAGAGTTRAR